MMASSFASLLLLPALLLGSGVESRPAALYTLPPAQAAAPAVWKIDTTHSELSFRIRHLVSRVRGTFTDWQGALTADPARLADGKVEVTIRTASIDTKQEKRDAHLRSDDFFDAEAHPTITFRSTRVEVNGEALRVHGDLTIRGVTRPVVLEGSYLGITPDGQGGQRIGFEAETKINRHDFGVSWNRAAEGGGVVLGDEVTINLVVAAVRS
jgi:polyisoprenoid-binding protein YceI